jgi:zinc protease
MWIKSLCGAGVLSVCSLSGALAQAPPSNAPPAFAAIAKTVVPADPALKTGVLANGVRYALMRPARPQQGASIRLGFDVGSFEESDAERGLAHFVEHLAFRSTRNFPNNTVETVFSTDGVAFGRDHNASTDLFSTVYMVNLNQPEQARFARAFTWLRDVADGIVFDPTAVEKERGVVLAEKEARDSAGQTTVEALMRFRAPGLRAIDRAPIGVDTVLRNATPTALQEFHRRWYRPEHAIVVVVSDLPADVLQAQIESAFGDWRSTGPAPPRAAYGRSDQERDLDVFTRADGSGLTSVEVCRLAAAEPRGPQDFAYVRRDALSLIWRDVFNRRLGLLRHAPSSQMLGAQVDVYTDDRNLRSACLSIKPTNDAWAPALAAGQAELSRFQVAGPTELEVEQAIDRVRSRLRGAITESANRAASELADNILTAMLDRQPLSEPRQMLRAYDLAVEDISASDVLAAFNRDWAGAGPLVSVVAPKAPQAAELRNAWLTQAKSSGLAAYADPEVASRWAYGDAPAGAVSGREDVASGFVRIRFRNGVVLNFKQTGFSRSKVAFLARFGGGRRQIADRDLLTAVLGAPAVPFGGLGKHAYDDIVRIMQVEVRDLAVQIGPDSFVIGADEQVANLENKLRITAAYLGDPGFRTTMNPLLHEGVELTYRMTDSTPSLKAANALSEVISPGSPVLLPPKAQLLAIDNARVAAILQPAMTLGPIDVTLVGDIDEKTAIRLVAGSFGALRARAPAPAPRPDAFFARYPAVTPPPVRAEHNGPVDKAVGEMVWPLYVATPTRRREEYAISLLASVFGDALRHELRGELGKAYAPTVVSQMPDHADQGALTAHLEGYPGDLDSLMAAARAVALRLAGGAISEEQLAAARAPMLVDHRQALATNARWAMAMSRSAVDDQNLRDLLGYEALITSIRLDEVKKAAADWLARDPIVVTATAANAPATATSGS